MSAIFNREGRNFCLRVQIRLFSESEWSPSHDKAHLSRSLSLFLYPSNEIVVTFPVLSLSLSLSLSLLSSAMPQGSLADVIYSMSLLASGRAS
jgi:hypothetical protein